MAKIINAPRAIWGEKEEKEEKERKKERQRKERQRNDTQTIDQERRCTSR